MKANEIRRAVHPFLRCNRRDADVRVLITLRVLERCGKVKCDSPSAAGGSWVAV